MSLNESLNPQQKQAVEITDGRVLVLAGAGSGKTKVIIHRIAHIIEGGVAPEHVLGLTFTNKAAAEMRERLSKLLSPTAAKKVVLCTFHSFCMKLLRKEIHHLGYTNQFSLYDERDVRRLLKQIARDVLEHEGDLPSIEPVMQAIAKAKSGGDLPREGISRTLFERLANNLRACNAVDFDSLLSLTVELFRDHPDVLAKYQELFRYIMIDEYQDTNPIQYQIAEMLSRKWGNLCVVGDDDQSIYGWRGAEIKNILSFDSTNVIKLEQNYRSLPTILKAANAVIANNSERHKKELYSRAPDSKPISVFHAPTEADEASAVVQRLLYLKKAHNLQWRDFAILYRSNALARPFEMALMQGMWQHNGEWKRGIPYQVFGGTELYERSEVKDLMAYLRFLANNQDDEALLRIVNVPRRGISDKTLAVLTEENRKAKIPLWKQMQGLNNHPQLQERAVKAVQTFVHLMIKSRDLFEQHELPEALEKFIDLIDYKKAIEEEVQSEKMRAFKWENIQSCIDAMQIYIEESDEPSLQDFLASTMLDQSRIPKREKDLIDNKVNVMTFHSAKGLEFEATFLVALEDHIIPHEKSFALEEERRLMYVAITRAKKHLTLSMARQRKRYGKDESSTPSRFLFEIPKELFKTISWRNPIG